MIVKIDIRETDLLQQITQHITNIPIFKSIVVKSEVLPIGDIIICDEKEEKLIIERKSVADLLSSIKDGRYEEQSYRLNGLNHHNHNIIYLVEGDVNRVNRFKSDNRIEKLTLYSAMFSLNYYKGFSVFRSFSLEESATIICNMAYKLEKEVASGKKAFYQNYVTHSEVNQQPLENQQSENLQPLENQPLKGGNNTQEDTLEQNEKVQSEKDYVGVIKKVKKENITPDNIGEIMLCQIPGISSVTALAIMEKYKSLPNLIKEIDINNDCLKDITSTNAKGQIRKINKTSIANIVKFLLKK
jgi:ERCC4-type nuclease